MKKLKLHDHSRRYNKYRITGFILSVLTLGYVFYIKYGYYFERRLYLNNNIVYDYIKENGLPEPYYISDNKMFCHWIIDGYKITLCDNKRWYIFKNHNCIMSSFIPDKTYKKKYEYILDELKKSLMSEKHVGNENG